MIFVGKKKATKGTELQFFKKMLFFLFFINFFIFFYVQKAPSEVEEWKTIK